MAVQDPRVGQYRMSGRWGMAYAPNGDIIADMVEVVSPAEVNRINVQVPGTLEQAYKRGPTTREGTMRVQKMDSRWEMKVWRWLTQDVEAMRAARDSGDANRIAAFDPRFRIIVANDDPEAYGKEEWQLDGVRIWRLPNGFNVADDLIEREYPITWERETPLTVFKKKRNENVGSYLDKGAAAWLNATAGG